MAHRSASDAPCSQEERAINGYRSRRSQLRGKDDICAEQGSGSSSAALATTFGRYVEGRGSACVVEGM